MPLVRLLYASRSTPACNTDTIRNILGISSKSNKEKGISGILCYDTHFFIQWIEGPRDEINRLYEIILKDPSHTQVTILDYREISARTFEKWSMAYISNYQPDQDILFKYSQTTEFDPFTLSADSAVELVYELANANEEFIHQTLHKDD
jgi:hypothetical protein